MTELPTIITKKDEKTTDIAMCWSVIVSNPLYLSYLIFFFPYILKLLSFLSPLFITISLLLLSLLTTFVPVTSIINPKDGFFLSVYTPLLEKLRPRFDENTEELEVYRIVFENPIIEVSEETPDENLENFKDIAEVSQDEAKTEGDDNEGETGGTNFNKAAKEEKKHEPIMFRTGSEVIKKTINEGVSPKFGSLRLDHEKMLNEAYTHTVGSPPYIGSFGSMRKEREWRRTLACKLFEERHSKVNERNVRVNGADEGMDLLWETYETETNRGKTGEVVIKKGKGEIIGDFLKGNNDHESSEYSFDEDEFDDSGKICCLQALKLSAGKMNLSMGRPNLIKIGKAFKGFGWLHSKRQGKKGYK